jgi:hypothetical protein
MTLPLIRMSCIVLALSIIIMGVNGDLYLHNMRGSNNRLAENTAQRTNGNRLFDSQVLTHYHYHYHCFIVVSYALHIPSIKWQLRLWALFVLPNPKNTNPKRPATMHTNPFSLFAYQIEQRSRWL